MRKFMKRSAGIALAATAALALAACSGDAGGGQGDSEVPDDDATYIAMVSKGFQHQFWQAVQKGAEEKAEELGVEITYEGPAAETQIDDQLNMLRTAIDRKPEAIAFAALDPEACVPLYEEAEAAEIPIVEFDAGCTASDYSASLAATDSKAAGALAADHMAELIGEEGEVGIVSHSQINSTGVDRRDGFVEQMEAEYPDIEIVDIQYGDGDHLKSADIAKAMISAHPDLKGLYGTNEGSAIGIVNAATELGLTGDDLTIIGFDSGAAQIEAIKNGTMAGAVTQDPMAIGALTVQSAYDVINGDTPEEFIDTGSYWFDADNIDSEEIQEKIYE